jgi:hypothetical protein
MKCMREWIYKSTFRDLGTSLVVSAQFYAPAMWTITAVKTSKHFNIKKPFQKNNHRYIQNSVTLKYQSNTF